MDAFDLREWGGFIAAGGSVSEPAIIDQIVIDSRRIDSPHALFVALKGEREDGHQYVSQAAKAGAKFALVSQEWQPPSPCLELTLLRVPNPLKGFQAIAKAYRLQLPTKIIGITGSFGKTMVKDLLLALLCPEKRTAASPESFNSQIGVTLSLLTLHKQHEIALIEAAISHKEEMDVLTDLIRPDYTLLTPIGKKHLATLQDIPTLVQETLKLIRSTPAHGWALLPRDPSVDGHYSSLNCASFFWNESDPLLPHASLLPSSPTSMYNLFFPEAILIRAI